MNLDARVGPLNQSHLDARKGQGRSANKWSGEFKVGQERSGSGESRLRKGQESLEGRESGQGLESQGSGEFRGHGKKESGEVRRKTGSEEVRGQVRSRQEISGVMRSRGFGEVRNLER
jgi:hypothetical protein